ncbi:DUF4262 domain-containing protein [Actinokineospora sp. 24-640]
MPGDDVCLCLICLDYGDQDRLDEVDTKLVRDIGDAGWGVVAIPGDRVSAGWTFTVGLWHTFRFPELAMFGLDGRLMQSCVNTVGNQVAAARAPAPGDDLGDILSDDYRLSLRPVDPGWHKPFFGAATGFYRATPSLPFLQLLWPDDDHLFPGHIDFDSDYDELQPQLWLPRHAHPPGPWTEDSGRLG